MPQTIPKTFKGRQVLVVFKNQTKKLQTNTIIRQFLQLYEKETLNGRLSAKNVNLSCHHVINKSTDNNKFIQSYNIRLSVFK